MIILKLFVLVVATFAVFFGTFTLALAQSPTPVPAQVVYENVNPNGGFSYIQKRLGEKIKLFFLSFSANSKEDFYRELVNRRLAELKYVIDNKDLNSFEIATIRYSSTIGEWTEFIIDRKLDNKKKAAREVMTSHLPVVEQLMLGFDGTTAEWRFVKQDFDYLNIYISKLQN